jgi:hypothetical protein
MGHYLQLTLLYPVPIRMGITFPVATSITFRVPPMLGAISHFESGDQAADHPA